MSKSLLSGIATVSMLAFGQTVHAETAVIVQNDTEVPSGDQDVSSGGLEQIVVTATRRSVNLQKVSATIEAVTADKLKAFNVNGVLQLPSLVSGLVVSPSGGNNLYLRGIGSPSTGFNEAQTAVYVDGLYLANPAASILSFNNIDRVEVLKGPQGTLYGRNVTGGLISVITRDPGTALKVDASIGYANYDTLTASAYASVPLSDTLAANIAVYHQKQSKGWGINLFNGHDDQKSDETGLEAKLLWKPSASSKVTASFIYDYNNRDYGYAYEVYPGTLGTDGTPYFGQYQHASRIDAKAPTHIYIGSLKIQQDLGFANLMSLSGYQTSNADVLFQGGVPILGQPIAGQSASYAPFYEKNRTFSQEFQLTSAPSDSRIDWVAGAFYYNDHTLLQLDTYSTCIGNVCAPGAPPTRNAGRPNTESLSGYGDITYRFFKATKLTVGLRYTSETKSLSGLVSALPGFPNSVAALTPACSATQGPPCTTYSPGDPFYATIGGVPTLQAGIPTRLHFNKLTYRFVLSQEITDDIQVYASHNLGFKSGAYNGNLYINTPARPELLYATEVGLKSELFDHRLRFNVAYFHYSYKDVQVRSIAPPAPPGNAILQNAASEHVDGIDGDFSIAAAKGLVLNGSFEYLRAKYVDFPGTTIATPGTKLVNGVLVGAATILQNQNLAGYDAPFAAPFSASFGFTYKFGTAIGDFAFSGNDHYNSPYALVADNSIRQTRHHVLDASLNWTSTDKHYDVNLFVRNLTKQYVWVVGQTSANFTVVPGAPQTFGGSFSVHF
jgi:iron complex outermembrane receptor protein